MFNDRFSSMVRERFNERPTGGRARVHATRPAAHTTSQPVPEPSHHSHPSPHHPEPWCGLGKAPSPVHPIGLIGRDGSESSELCVGACASMVEWWRGAGEV